MAAISRVLHAVDIDDTSGAAFEQALAIARARDAKLILVCAVPPSEPFSHRASDRLTALIHMRRRAEAAGVEVHTDVQTGETAEIVALHARARRADVVVVGLEHGRAGGQAWAAVAEEVLRSASFPTLVVPAGTAPAATFHRIICATDIAPAAWVPIDRALSLADPREHTATLLHVVGRDSDGPAAMQALQTLLQRQPGAPVLARVAVGPVAQQILQAVHTSNADLLVIGARKRSRVGRRLFGITRELLTTAPCPVLAVPVQESGSQQLDREAA